MSKDTDAKRLEAAREHLQSLGRNDPCHCGSGKKYKKCHLQGDEATALPPPAPPDPQEMVQNGWRLFEQRRPGAAEKEFRAALALAPGSTDALVGIGMAKLQAGDNEAARKELGEVLRLSEGLATELRKSNVKDAFTRKEAQAFIRAAHALGCLDYDENRFDEALAHLEQVFAVDEGPVGTEARLIAGKTLVKLQRAAEAVTVLEPAVSSELGGGRAQMGLVLAQLKAGDRPAATATLRRALEANPHYGKAVLGQIRKRVDAIAGTAPGSREEAAVYAQTYGDVWDDEAKAFLAEALTGPAKGAPSTEESAPPAGG